MVLIDSTKNSLRDGREKEREVWEVYDETAAGLERGKDGQVNDQEVEDGIAYLEGGEDKAEVFNENENVEEGNSPAKKRRSI